MRNTAIPAIRPRWRRRSEGAQETPPEQVYDEQAAVLVDEVPDQGDVSPTSSKRRRRRYVRKPSAAVAASLIILIVLSGLTGWLGYRTYETRQTQQQRSLFLQVGRQGALNLTTISAAEAESDVKRILDSSTGTFYDQVHNGSQQFMATVQQAQTDSVGTIAEAGIESEQGDHAQVLVAVNVKSSNTGGATQPTRPWRMRITVQRVDGGAKVSDVEFVS